MACKCGSKRIADISGKSSDCNNISIGGTTVDVHSEYVPRDMGIGGGDYLRFSFCMDCGQMQGTFPIPETELEETAKENEEIEDEE